MKRKELLKKPKAAGLVLEEGDEHTRGLRGDVPITVVPRHREITAKKS